MSGPCHPAWMDPDYPTQVPITPGVPQPPPPVPAPYYPPASSPPYYPPPPQSAPPAGYYQPYGPPPPQVVTKPGGLSSAAHAGHIIACILTCGVWLPFYVLFILFAPNRRTEVIVPYGADPVAVQAAYAAAAPTEQERKAHNLTVIVVISTIGGIILLCLVIGALASRGNGRPVSQDIRTSSAVPR
jgi:hypothetical protein